MKKCDFCGKELTEDAVLSFSGENIKDGDETRPARICSDCIKECYDIMKQYTKNKAEKQNIDLTPDVIKADLDEWVIGQESAKKTVAKKTVAKAAKPAAKTAKAPAAKAAPAKKAAAAKKPVAKKTAPKKAVAKAKPVVKAASKTTKAVKAVKPATKKVAVAKKPVAKKAAPKKTVAKKAK